MRRAVKSFREKIYEVVGEIPRGKVASYGLVAILAGRPGAARAVGAAMREVPEGMKLAAWRVIKADVGALALSDVWGEAERLFGEGGGEVLGRGEGGDGEV